MPHTRGNTISGVQSSIRHRNTPPTVPFRKRLAPHVRGEDSYGRYLLGSYGDPHMCGEAPKFVARISCVLETPPRAWGRPPLALSARHCTRNTPTCVGKTSSPVRREAYFRKHPHVRGEDRSAIVAGLSYLETPPRAWGRQCIRASPGSHDGNTPTCVGKTRGPGHREPGMRKHPHVRGEDLSCRVTDTFKTETPPRAWGRRVGCRFLQTYGRNTPTCVGKTPRRFSACSRLGKHPHVRGEDNIGIRAVFRVGETPPRAWGRHSSL